VSLIHKEGKEPGFIYLSVYGCTIFNSRVNVLNENTVMTEGLQITLFYNEFYISC